MANRTGGLFFVLLGVAVAAADDPPPPQPAAPGFEAAVATLQAVTPVAGTNDQARAAWRRLAAAARALADGELRARVPVDGVRETASVATAFNEMGEALDSRTADLEKAVADLRESNRELRDARAGLDRAERLAAVGRLAAGVAHEVGNPMGALLAFVDLAGRDEGLSDASRSHLDRAAREGERVRHILRQLLDFSRPRPIEPRAIDLAALCEETAQLVRAQRRYARIAISVEQEGEAPPALADPGRVSQILLNLLLNAADAVGPGGRFLRGRRELLTPSGPVVV